MPGDLVPGADEIRRHQVAAQNSTAAKSPVSEKVHLSNHARARGAAGPGSSPRRACATSAPPAARPATIRIRKVP
jgi:hypothetical protein